MAQVNQKRKASDDKPEEPEDEEDEKLCRFCFDGEEDDAGELIDPCQCKGGQKYIHLSCLRQWQRMVLVSQPTHPDFWEDDVRHKKCNVCKSDFTCAPPTRQELMLGFTGPEIAALISPGCIIASHSSFNRQIEEQISDNPLLAQLSSVQHWLKCAYLITKVQEDTGEIEYPILDKRDLTKLLDSRLDYFDDENGFCLELMDDTRYKLQAEGPLAGLALAKDTDFKSLLAKNTFPFYLVFKPTVPTNDCTDDKVAAVNLTRPFTIRSPGLLRRTEQAIKDTHAQDVDVTYFKGGPCEDDQIVTCIVLGGRRTGYTVVPKRDGFRTALRLAKRNACHAKKEGRNNIAVGQDVVLQGLCQRADLNGRRGLVQAFHEGQGRFEVRLLEPQQQQQQQEEEGEEGNDKQQSQPAMDTKVSVKPTNLVAHSSGIGKNGTVLAFVGDARWTRVQLLGEIAKTSWGLCQSQTADLFRPPSDLYDQAVFSRLVYAPESEMSEASARDNMVTLRRSAEEAANYVQEAGE